LLLYPQRVMAMFLSSIGPLALRRHLVLRVKRHSLPRVLGQNGTLMALRSALDLDRSLLL
jgi:hypothetical protein